MDVGKNPKVGNEVQFVYNVISKYNDWSLEGVTIYDHVHNAIQN